jgi:hypothetical protein
LPQISAQGATGQSRARLAEAAFGKQPGPENFSEGQLKFHKLSTTEAYDPTNPATRSQTAMIDLHQHADKLSYYVTEQCFEAAQELLCGTLQQIRDYEEMNESDLEAAGRILWIATWLSLADSLPCFGDTLRKVCNAATTMLGNNHTVTRHLRMCLFRLKNDHDGLAAEFARCLKEDGAHPNSRHLRSARKAVFDHYVSQRKYDHCRTALRVALAQAVDREADEACVDVIDKLQLLRAHERLDKKQRVAFERKEMVCVIILRQALSGMPWRNACACTMAHTGISRDDIEQQLTALLAE